MFPTLFLEKFMMRADRAELAAAPANGSVPFSIFGNSIFVNVCKG